MLQYLKKFLYVIRTDIKKIIILLLALIFSSAIEAFSIGLVGPFINLASYPNIIFQNYWLNWAYTESGVISPNQFIAIIGLLIIVLFCIKSYIYWWVQTYIVIFAYQVQGKLIRKLLHAYLSAPYTFHLDKSSAYVIQNIIKETQNFTNSTLIPIINFASSLVVTLCLGVLLTITNLATVILILGILLPLLLIFKHFKNQLSYWGRESSDANESIIRIINHGLGGIKETKVIGCSSYFRFQLSEQTRRYLDSASGYYSFLLLPRVIIESILVLFLIGLTSVFLILNQDIKQLTTVVSVFGLASIRLIPAVNNLASGASAIRYSSITLNKLYQDLKELELVETNKLEIVTLKNLVKRDESRQKNEIRFRNKIVLDAVNYRYPDAEKNSLNNLFLTITKGQSIAFIGRSGAGKTTLVDVILGLLIPTSGDIKVDGKSVYDNLRSWQDLIGYIPQSIFLIDDTIERNIAFGVPDSLIDRGRLNKAIQTAQLVELIEKLPKGTQTTVGERGVLLSGGQRQRIGIARALYHEREILILDEATAALDNETESLISEAIQSLSGAKTLIIIAHRLTTIEHCHKIHLMEKGCILKSGTYKEVVLGEE